MLCPLKCWEKIKSDNSETIPYLHTIWLEHALEHSSIVHVPALVHRCQFHPRDRDHRASAPQECAPAQPRRPLLGLFCESCSPAAALKLLSSSLGISLTPADSVKYLGCPREGCTSVKCGEECCFLDFSLDNPTHAFDLEESSGFEICP